MGLSNFLQSKVKSATPSQKFLEIKDIKDDVIILKNGGLRAVCLVSSINFELKSDDEQQAFINRYQGFLNSLDFPVQILINSRKFDITPYLENLRDLGKTQQNELLHAQIIEYTDFIEKFVKLTDVMNKSFYIVVPYNPLSGKKEGFLDKFKAIIGQEQNNQKIPPEKFQEYKEELTQRIDHVVNGLTALGLNSVVLKTSQLISLFYNFYNPSY